MYAATRLVGVLKKYEEERIPCFWELVADDYKVVVVFNYFPLWIRLGLLEICAQPVAWIESFDDILRLFERT